LFLALPRDFLLRLVALSAAAVFMRDGIAGFRGARLVIIKGYYVRGLEGWAAKLLAILMLLFAILLLGIALAGWP